LRTDPFHVVIIGAGYSGLALAHALRRARVSCAVYEAQPSRADGPDGYPVGLDLAGHRALKRCLPPELFATVLATSARAPRSLTVLSEKKEVTAAFALGGNGGEITSGHSVPGRRLRQLLLTGLDDQVHFGKEFTRYDQQADGTVTALFADGSAASGQVLVAADGAHSRVRAQYLPHVVPEPHGIVTIGAKVPLTRAARKLLPARSRDGLSLVFGPGGFSCVWQVMEFGPGPLPGRARDCITWGLWAPQDRFPAGVLRLRGRELTELVLQLTTGWHRDFRALFSLSDPATPFPLEIALAEPLPAWRSSNVTLAGDAIHPMAPGQRVGANTALRDAMLLSHALAAVSGGRVGLRNAISAYEAEVTRSGSGPAGLGLAGRATADRSQPDQPLAGRAVLNAGRARLSAAAAPLANWMAPLRWNA
jgi:2-polyprenyl-6-methoxyphenol hydroxylase-like FAD-dependent oxidoreductase